MPHVRTATRYDFSHSNCTRMELQVTETINLTDATVEEHGMLLSIRLATDETIACHFDKDAQCLTWAFSIRQQLTKFAQARARKATSVRRCSHLSLPSKESTTCFSRCTSMHVCIADGSREHISQCFSSFTHTSMEIQ